MTTKIKIALLSFFLLLQTTLVSGQNDNPAWLDDLTFQIKNEQACDVGFYIFTRDYELGGRQVKEAKVQCVDGRQFDASKTTPEIMFTIKECDTTLC